MPIGTRYQVREFLVSGPHYTWTNVAGPNLIPVAFMWQIHCHWLLSKQSSIVVTTERASEILRRGQQLQFFVVYWLRGITT
jgi:hypothetical protein